MRRPFFFLAFLFFLAFAVEGWSVLQAGGAFIKGSLIDEMLGFASWVLIPLALLLAGAFAWSWSLRRQVALRTSELRRSEEQVRKLVEASPVPIVISEHNRTIVYVNKKFTELFGYTLEDIPTVEAWWPLAYPDEEYRRIVRDRWNRAVARAIEEGTEIAPQEAMITCKDGSSRYVIGRLSSIDDREFVVLHDITDRMEAEKALQWSLAETAEARDKVDLILKSITDGLIVTDLDGRIVLMNRSAEKMLDLSFRELLDRPLEDVVMEMELREQLAVLQECAGEEAPVELEMPAGADGAVRTIQARSSLVMGEGGTKAGVIILLRDVSRDRELERMKSEFIATAAHELRTPLTSAKGFAELLLNTEGLSSEERKEYLCHVYEKSEVLERIIDDLLDLGRVESGRIIHLEKEPCDLRDLIEASVTLYRKGFMDHPFLLEWPGEGPVPVSADPGKIAQVMENLLSNAVKFSPSGSPVRVSGEIYGGEVRVAVNDRGKGMTPEQVRRVFDKFYRADTSDTAVGGLGLGMAIVKSIVEAHGGRIWVESEEGRGTTVTFTLPLEGGGL